MTETLSAIIADRIVQLAWQSNSASSDTKTPLSNAQWAAVRFLARSNAISRKPSVFAEFHGTTRGTASQTLKSLEAAGFARREKDKTDGRSVRFTLTEEGQKLAQNDPVLRLSQAVSHLQQGDQKKLGELIEHLSVEMAHHGDHRCLGCCYDCHHFEPCETPSNQGACRLSDPPEMVEQPSELCAFFEPA